MDLELSAKRVFDSISSQTCVGLAAMVEFANSARWDGPEGSPQIMSLKV